MAIAAPAGVPEARRRIAWAATATLVGIALSLMVDETIGSWITVAAFALLLHALHRFGRSGAS